MRSASFSGPCIVNIRYKFLPTPSSYNNTTIITLDTYMMARIHQDCLCPSFTIHWVAIAAIVSLDPFKLRGDTNSLHLKKKDNGAMAGTEPDTTT